jgi:hypothetical protein
MSKRIRYEAVDELWVRSTRIFRAGEKQYRVFLRTDTLEYRIADPHTGAAVLEGTGPSLGRLKIRAKEALEKLGVEFEDEERNVS